MHRYPCVFCVDWQSAVYVHDAPELVLPVEPLLQPMDITNARAMVAVCELGVLLMVVALLIFTA